MISYGTQLKENLDSYIVQYGGDWILVIDRVEIARFPTEKDAKKQQNILTMQSPDKSKSSL